jgi:putative membrane protein
MTEARMMKNYTDRAANERTFLAWVRTGVAVIALGFVIEKFSLFLSTIEATLGTAPEALHHRLSGIFGRLGGLALVLAGVGLIALSVLRFLRTERLLAATEDVTRDGIERIELYLLIATLLSVAAFSAYAALG